ncbi:hypothetical protein ACODUO_15110 [Stenotrophomonas maltophilia]
MNATMADGAEQRLDAQIAEALFGQPGMSKMDVANRVRELRGDGPALLVDVQTGGSVRPGDWLPPLPPEVDAVRCMIRGEEDMAEACDYYYTADQMRDYARAALSERIGQDGTLTDAARAAIPFVAYAFSEGVTGAEEAGRAIEAALAAQPSPGGQDALLGYVRVEAIKALREDDEVTGVMVHVEERADSVPVYLAARQPVELIAKKVGDYRVTVAEDAITVSHGRDIVFAYSAGDPEPINARQPVGEEENVAADTYWTVAGMIEPHIQDGALPASVHDSVAILLDHWLKTRQPVGQEPVAWLVHWSDMPMESPEVTRSASRISEVSALTNPPRIVPLYAASPAQAVDLAIPIAMIDRALGHLSTALDDTDSSPDRRPGAMVAEAIGCLHQALTGVQP